MIRDIAAVVTAIGVIFTGIGIMIGALGLQQAKRHRIRDFEDFYVRRYWELIDKLPFDTVLGRVSIISEEDEKIIFLSPAV